MTIIGALEQVQPRLILRIGSLGKRAIYAVGMAVGCCFLMGSGGSGGSCRVRVVGHDYYQRGTKTLVS